MKSFVFAALGAAIALAGSNKLAGLRGYKEMFHGLGWSDAEMRAAAAAEVAGGLLMVPEATRGLGGAIVATTSAAVLAAEVGHRDNNLAVPRSLILVLALIATADRLMQRA